MLWSTNLVWWISEKPHQDVVVELVLFCRIVPFWAWQRWKIWC